jgi:hypothetical protein
MLNPPDCRSPRLTGPWACPCWHPGRAASPTRATRPGSRATSPPPPTTPADWVARPGATSRGPPVARMPGPGTRRGATGLAAPAAPRRARRTQPRDLRRARIHAELHASPGTCRAPSAPRRASGSSTAMLLPKDHLRSDRLGRWAGSAEVDTPTCMGHGHRRNTAALPVVSRVGHA